MGRFLSEQEIIEKNIDKYVQRTTSEYNRFIEGTPTFVTYYHRDIINSTYDGGLENIERDLGRDSPTRFKKIKNFPLFNLDSMSLSLSIEDQGLDTNYESTSIVLPGTLVPLPEDFFVIPYLGKLFLFKVTNVTPDAIKQKPYYKIDFIFSKYIDDISDIESQVLSSYTFIYRNIGTDNKPIIEDNNFFLLDYIDKLLSKLIDQYVSSFFDSKINSIILNYTDLNEPEVIDPMTGSLVNHKKLYNMYLNKFIINNFLLKQNYEYLNTIALKNSFPEDHIFFSNYKTTIFHSLEKQYTGNLTGVYMNHSVMCSRHREFLYYQNKFSLVEYSEVLNGNLSIPIFPDQFIERVKSNRPYLGENISILGNPDNPEYLNIEGYVSDDNLLQNIIIKYINKELILNTQLLDRINSIEFITDIYSYTFEIILIFILKKMRDQITKSIM